METATVLPAFEDCLELYLQAHDQFGTDPFTAEQIEPATSSSQTLELAVAYGLLDFDGTTYRVRCAPDAGEDCWESILSRRVERYTREIARLAGPGRHPPSPDDGDRMTHDGRTYVSVPVSPTDGFDAVVQAVADRSGDGQDGVVLRSQAEHATAVQRYADRLCDGSALAETPLSNPFGKVTSDVVGDDKDDLEFRLFLARP